jgi:RNA 2',3'-cyclic 3'-phosphodiesterase
MRLFIGIRFDSACRERMVEIQNRFRTHTLRGNFTSEDNLHLTVEFLGEIHPARIPALQIAMRTINTAPFDLAFDTIGSFRKENRDIVWIGVQRNPILLDLQNNLAQALKIQGFTLENRP